jgi:hypothetical protein
MKRGERDEQHHAGAPRGRGEAAEDARPGPQVPPRGVDRADGEQQEQALGVDGRVEERHGKERGQPDGMAGGVRPELQRGQPPEEVQRPAQARGRHEQAAQERRAEGQAREVREQREQRKERGTRLAARVAVGRDGQVPDAVPAGGGPHEQVPQGAEGRGEPGGIEVRAPGRDPRDGDPGQPGRPDDQPRDEEGRRRVGQRRAPPAARRAGRGMSARERTRPPPRGGRPGAVPASASLASPAMAHIVAQASFGRYDSEVKAALSLLLALAAAWRSTARCWPTAGRSPPAWPAGASRRSPTRGCASCGA